MRCALFIRSYWRDFDWLALSLASVARYCHGFDDLVIVTPRRSEPWLRRARLPQVGRIEFCRDYRDDYLGQQATKLHADQFTDADFICHIDSDCVFTRWVSPEDFVVDDKPGIMMRPLERLRRERPWLKPTEKFLGTPVAFDFMCHPPFTFPRWLYARVREHSVTQHGQDVETYLERQPPRGFSEFNVLGALAWLRWRERFAWTTWTDGAVDSPLRWYWSWDRVRPDTRAEIEKIVGAHESTS
jgi:Family of unknown function (DUF6492)